MKIRDAVIDDLPRIIEIYNSTILSKKVTADIELVTIEDKLNWFYQHTPSRRPLWVAETEHNIIGWISFQDFYGRPAYNGTSEISIYIDENYRNKGFGKRMLTYAFIHCHQLKIDTLLGFIFEENLESIRLFKSLGFNEWGHLPEIANMGNHKLGLKIFGKKINQ
jgi:phosphinothricin acetyltransferase